MQWRAFRNERKTHPAKARLASAEGPWHHHGALPERNARREQVIDEICKCGHRKSQHEAIVCDWWKCHCKQFEPLTPEEPKREWKPVEEFPSASDLISADVAAEEVEQLRSKLYAANEVIERFQPLTPEEPKRERKLVEDIPSESDLITADVAAQEVEQLRSSLHAAQEEIGRLKQLQEENHMLATRLGVENNLLREALAEIKRLVEAILARP